MRARAHQRESGRPTSWPRSVVSKCKTLVYRRPLDEFRRCARWGVLPYFRCNAWARAMERAAERLRMTDPGPTGRVVEVWFLTGARFWYQTAFCAWTLARQSERQLIVNLVDDGTLTPTHEAHLRRLFPEGKTVWKEAAGRRLDTLLPRERYPVLRQRWADYVNIRKLTDIHLGSRGVKLVLDSDMLFFRRPDALLNWWDRAGRLTADRRPFPGEEAESEAEFAPCLMTDCVESYGYSRPLMEELAGAPIPPLLNVGICGLRSEDLDWDELETWCRTLVEREGTSYFLEQALVAMLAARSGPVVMSKQDYITFPTREQTQLATGVLQHYVADSKPWYFGDAWRLASRA